MGTGSAPRLLCVGDIDMDIILRVAEPPGRDQKVDGVRIAQTPGGMAANVAVAARRLGTPTRLVGAVGRDTMGDDALKALRAEDIDISHVAILADAATFFCVIMVDNAGEKSLVKAVSPAYLPRAEDLSMAAFHDVSHLHMTFTRSDLALHAIDLGRRAGASISLDLEAADLPEDGGRIRSLVDRLDLLFISDQSRSIVEHRLGPLPRSEGLTVITTRGADGARLERGEVRFEVPGHAVEVTDTSGAGDAFAGAFLHFRLDGAGDADALHHANAAAALSTRAFGAQAGAPTADALRAFLNQRHGTSDA